MNKILICLLAAIILTNCELKVRETQAQKAGRGFYQNDFYESGMHYRLFTYIHALK